MRIWCLIPLLPLVVAGIAGAQENAAGTIRVYAVTEVGTPVASARVRIEGGGTTRTVDLNGPTPITLPFGVYTLACIHRTLATQFKVVRVERPGPIDVVFGLPLANPGQVHGEGNFTPFEIVGRATPAPGRLFGRVKAVGVFTEVSADSTIDGEGRFRLLVRDEGVYRIFFLYGNEIVHEETLNLNWSMPREVRLDVSTDRPQPKPK